TPRSSCCTRSTSTSPERGGGLAPLFPLPLSPTRANYRAVRSLGVLGAAGRLAAAPCGTAGAVGQASPRLTLVLPQPGHVTLAEVRFRLPDVQGEGLRMRVPFPLPSPNTLPNGAKALSAVRARRG